MMTEKTERAVAFWVIAVVGLPIAVLMRHGTGNPIKTGADAIAVLVYLAFALSIFGTGRLASDPVYRRKRQDTRLGDLFLITGLFAAGYAMVTWGVGHVLPYSRGSVLLLIGVAFNLGRWRGQRDAGIALSESPHEIWAR